MFLPVHAVALLALASCLHGAPAEDAAEGYPFTEVQLADRYIKEFQRWAKEDQGKTPSRDSVLCVGSSSMRMWRTIKRDLAPLKIIHRGFGGSTMAHVVRFLDFFLRYEAEAILVYEGDNDLMSTKTTPDLFVANCRTFAEAVFERRSDTRIYFICPKPSIKRWQNWPKFSAANDKLRAFCEADPRLTFVDVAAPMLGEDGTPRKDIFLKDNLHMNAEGYKIWTKVVRDALITRDADKGKAEEQ